jgi:membrane-associated phospholipid phosphatase
MPIHNRSVLVRRCGRTLASLSLVGTAILPSRIMAQADSVRDTTHAQKQAPFFVRKDAILAGVFAGVTLLAAPFDKRAALELQDSSAQANRFFKHAATGAELIASPGAYIIGGTLYAVGRIGRFDRVADLGLHGTEAVLFAQGVTFVLKGTVGRSRPFLTNAKDPDDFHLGKGFSSADWTSFPSGHTSTAFAAAAAVTNETTRWWPRSVWVVGPLMYGGATAVGLSRMYHNKHWASDVALGAAIGTFSGRKVVQYQHGHPGNRLDQLLLRTSVTPDGHGGTMLAVTLPTP